jgi:Holliday junction resolvasome RuvABC endonuclease subunit
MAVPSILAIDFSKSRTGVCFGRPGQRPTLSSKSFAKWEGATLDEAAAGVIQWLPEVLSVYKPDLIALEAALPPIASRDQISARLALGADFMIKGAAKIRGIRCFEIHGNTWKSAILGSGNLPSSQAKKKSLQLCRGMGLEPKDDNEADAYAIWLYAGIHIAKFNDADALAAIAKLQWKLVA